MRAGLAGGEASNGGSLADPARWASGLHSYTSRHDQQAGGSHDAHMLEGLPGQQLEAGAADWSEESVSVM